MDGSMSFGAPSSSFCGRAHDTRATGPTTKAVVVQYRTNPNGRTRNQELIEAVFADLEAEHPKGSRATAARRRGHYVGASWHEENDGLVTEPPPSGFVANIDERCDVAPVHEGSDASGQLALASARPALGWFGARGILPISRRVPSLGAGRVAPTARTSVRVKSLPSQPDGRSGPPPIIVPEPPANPSPGPEATRPGRRDGPR